MSNKKKATADYMQEDAFKEAVLPMLEQAYRQGYADAKRDYSLHVCTDDNCCVGDPE